MCPVRNVTYLLGCTVGRDAGYIVQQIADVLAEQSSDTESVSATA
jgi:hypothetical protein